MTEADGSTTVVYVMDVADRPGIVHAIAAVFAHRGLSMRALIADAHRRPPRILAIFNGTSRQARLVSQVLARLHDINSVRMLSADSEELHAVAVCRVGEAALPELGAAVSIQKAGNAWLLSGSYAAIESALAILRESGCRLDISRSLVAL